MSEPLELVRSALRERECGACNGNRFDCRCPSHEDRNPSLSVAVGADGRVLLRCHAGCSTAQIAAALGLTLPDLFASRNGDGGERKGGLGKLAATYDYLDERGALLYQVCRFEPKDFRQRRPDENGDGWKWGLGSARRVLYRLPQVVEAVESGAPVWVCEGERDVHSLEAQGVTATTCPMGALKWRDEYSEALAHANVVVLADSDEPGLEHARLVAKSLEGVAATVEAERCPDPHKDASELLAAGGKLDDLLPLAGAEQAEDARGAAPSSAAEALATSRVDLVALIEGGLPERPFVPGAAWLPQGKRVVVAAERKTGKSLAFGVVAALDIVAAGGVVVVLDRENGQDEYARRLDSVLTARGVSPAMRDLVRRNYRYHAWPLLKLEWGEDPVAYAQAFAGATAVVLDSTRKFLTSVALKEDDSDDYARFTELLIDPLARAGIATVLLDNTGHGAKDRSRGTSAKEDLVDLVFSLKSALGFSLARRGTLELSCRASRLGEVEGSWMLDLGGGKYGSWHRKDGADSRAAFHDACVAALAEQAPLGRDRLLKAARDLGAGGGEDTLREWLTEFVGDDFSPIQSTKAGYIVDSGGGWTISPSTPVHPASEGYGPEPPFRGSVHPPGRDPGSTPTQPPEQLFPENGRSDVPAQDDAAVVRETVALHLVKDAPVVVPDEKAPVGPRMFVRVAEAVTAVLADGEWHSTSRSRIDSPRSG